MDDVDRDAGYAVEYGGDETFVDDDEYVEYTLSWDEPEPQPVIRAERVVHFDDSVTEPLRSHPDHLLHAPAETWHSDPVESWHSLLDDDFPTDRPPVKPHNSEPIGFAHNGFHVDEEQRFQPLPRADETRPSRHERSARHYLPSEQPEKRAFWFESNGRHSRDDPDDASRYGRHSLPGHD
jgi:hypothetical protein